MINTIHLPRKKTFRNGFLLFLFSVSICFPVSAQDSVRYTLRECIEIGLQQNFSIKIAQNREQIAINNATLGNAGYLPSLNLTSSYSGTINNTRSEARESGDITRTDGVHNNTLNAGLNLSWTLFDGLLIQTNYEKLQEMKRMGALQTRYSIENYIAQLSAAYYNNITQVRRLRTFHYAVQLSRERLRIVETRYEVGESSRLDLQQARVDFNADSSKWLKQVESVKTSQYNLSRMMALSDVYTILSPASFEYDINYQLQGEELLERTMNANSQLLLSARNKQLSALDLKAAQSRNYPYVRTNAGYGYTLNQYEIAANRNQQTLGFNYGLTVGMTLFDGLNRSREQKNARIAIMNAENQHQELEISLRTDLATFFEAYKNYISLVSLEQKNLTVAQENYEIAMERYKLGSLAGIELREAQKSLLDAEERLITAEYNTKLCEISLLQLSGQLPDLIQ